MGRLLLKIPKAIKAGVEGAVEVEVRYFEARPVGGHEPVPLDKRLQFKSLTVLGG